MFESARDDLIDALSDKQAPLSFDEAKAAVDGGEIMAESAINNFGTTATQDEVKYITAVQGGPTFDLNDIDGSVNEDDDTDATETDPETTTTEPDPEPSPTPEPTPAPTQDASWEAGNDLDIYEINGLKITVDPEKELAGEPTGDDWYGLPVLENGHDGVPNETTPYFPVEVNPGNRDSEEWAGRVLGEKFRPLLLEGEAGTGKNRLIDRAASATNRITQRIGFGADVSVFDLVGEKDFADGMSYYVLGDLAKAAMFGHTCIWDEVNMVSGDVSSFLHGLAEEVGNRSLEIRGTDITLTDIPVSQDKIDSAGSWYEAAREKWNAEDHLGKYIHPEFRVTATCNPLDYAATKEMNDAFRDRFIVVEHPYLPPKTESQLLAEETGADPSDVRPLAALATTLREAREQANAISCPITHRSILKTVEIAGADESFMSYREAALNVMVDHASTKQDKQYIADAVKDEL